MREAKEFQKIYKIALLVSISCVLQIAESVIPHPIPGLRLGLANIMTLIALVTLGFKASLEVAILRTILSSFMIGTFMSPTFILSFSGALVSTLAMGFFYWLARIQRHYRLSIVGISIVGAFSNNMIQLYLAYLILVRRKGIFVFFPWLSIGALAMGWVTGIAAASICLKLKETEGRQVATKEFKSNNSLSKFHHYSPGSSFFHQLPAQIKIVSLFILSLVVLVFSNFWFYMALSLFLITIVLISRAPFDFIFSRIRKCVSLVFASFLLPVFFNSGKHVLSNIAYFKITSEGLSTGAIFAFRIIFLILASSLLVRITSPQDLTRGLTKTLSPLKPFGISRERIAIILSLSWMAIPVFWEMARGIIREIDLKKAKKISNLIPLLSDFITRFYLETEQVSAFWENENQSLIRKEVDTYTGGAVNG